MIGTSTVSLILGATVEFSNSLSKRRCSVKRVCKVDTRSCRITAGESGLQVGVRTDELTLLFCALKNTLDPKSLSTSYVTAMINQKAVMALDTTGRNANHLQYAFILTLCNRYLLRLIDCCFVHNIGANIVLPKSCSYLQPLGQMSRLVVTHIHIAATG